MLLMLCAAQAQQGAQLMLMLALSGLSGPTRGQLMLLMLALCSSGAARGPADAADARFVRLRRSKGPDDARLVGPLRPSKGPAAG